MALLIRKTAINTARHTRAPKPILNCDTGESFETMLSTTTAACTMAEITAPVRAQFLITLAHLVRFRKPSAQTAKITRSIIKIITIRIKAINISSVWSPKSVLPRKSGSFIIVPPVKPVIIPMSPAENEPS